MKLIYNSMEEYYADDDVKPPIEGEELFSNGFETRSEYKAWFKTLREAISVHGKHLTTKPEGRKTRRWSAEASYGVSWKDGSHRKTYHVTYVQETGEVIAQGEHGVVYVLAYGPCPTQFDENELYPTLAYSDRPRWYAYLDFVLQGQHDMYTDDNGMTWLKERLARFPAYDNTDANYTPPLPF